MTDYALKISIGLDGVPQVTGGLSQVEGAMDNTASKTTAATGRMAGGMGDVEGAVGRLAVGFGSAGEIIMGALTAIGVGFSLDAVIHQVESAIDTINTFQLSVIQMGAILTSLQVANGTAGSDIAETYRQTKEYAEGVNNALMKIEPSTSLSIAGLQRINLEPVFSCIS